jgi:tetratricopeptide (TPR) repeat protein
MNLRRLLPLPLLLLVACLPPAGSQASPRQVPDPAVTEAEALLMAGPPGDLEAADRLGRFLAAHPDDDRARALLGIALFSLRRFDGALAAFDRVLQGARDRRTLLPPYVRYKAWTLYMLGRSEEATRLLDAHEAYWTGDFRGDLADLRARLRGGAHIEKDLSPVPELRELRELAGKGLDILGREDRYGPRHLYALLLTRENLARYDGDADLSRFTARPDFEDGVAKVLFLPQVSSDDDFWLVTFQHGAAQSVARLPYASYAALDGKRLAAATRLLRPKEREPCGKPFYLRLNNLVSDDGRPLQALEIMSPCGLAWSLMPAREGASPVAVTLSPGP